eukprot:3102773-Pleurochrysis_carterae.AAC.1
MSPPSLIRRINYLQRRCKAWRSAAKGGQHKGGGGMERDKDAPKRRSIGKQRVASAASVRRRVMRGKE